MSAEPPVTAASCQAEKKDVAGKRVVGISLRAYARHRRSLGLPGGTLSAVQKAVRDGRITLGRRGQINPAAADADWEEHTDMRQPGGGAAASRGAPQTGAGAAREPAPLKQSAAIPKFNVSRAAREAYAAMRAKVEYELLSGSVVKADRVQAEAFALARAWRDAMLAVPGRLASLLAAETDPAKIEALLLDELRGVAESQSRAEP